MRCIVVKGHDVRFVLIEAIAGSLRDMIFIRHQVTVIMEYNKNDSYFHVLTL